LNIKSLKLFFLTQKRLLEAQKENRKGHLIYGSLKEEQFNLLLFLSLRDFKAETEQVKYFCSSENIQDLSLRGFVVITKVNSKYYYHITPKGVLYLDELINDFLVNCTNIDKHINIKGYG